MPSPDSSPEFRRPRQRKYYPSPSSSPTPRRCAWPTPAGPTHRGSRSSGASGAMRPEPRWIPGRTAGYSAHLTWYLLAEIVPAGKAEQSLSIISASTSFAPCGMNDTFLAMTPGSRRSYADRLANHKVTEKGAPVDLGTETPAALAVPAPQPAASAVRARELGLFYRRLLDRGRPILSPQSTEAMTGAASRQHHGQDLPRRHRLGPGFHHQLEHLRQSRCALSVRPARLARARSGIQAIKSSTGSRRSGKRSGRRDSCLNGLPGETKHQARMRKRFRPSTRT